MKLWSDSFVLFFSKNFLDFEWNTNELKGIINFSSSNNKWYASVAISDSKVTVLDERSDETFCSFLF